MALNQFRWISYVYLKCLLKCFEFRSSFATMLKAILAHIASWAMSLNCVESNFCCGCGCLTPFRQTRVPWLQTVRFSLGLGSGQSGEEPEHTLSFWQSVSSSQVWPAGLNPQSWPQHRPWLGLMDENIIHMYNKTKPHQKIEHRQNSLDECGVLLQLKIMKDYRDIPQKPIKLKTMPIYYKC